MARKAKRSRKPAKKSVRRAKAVSKKRPAKKARAKRAGKARVKRAKKSSKKVKEKPPEFPWRVPLKGEMFMGVVEDFFGHIGVIALTLKAPLNVGDRFHVRGHTSDFLQTVNSMQIERAAVSSAKVGDSVGIKVDQRARKGDYVYKAAAA